MAYTSLTPTQQSLPAAALPGTWKLGAGRAITLHPREDAVLKVAHGRLWLTFEGPHAGALNEQGDLFLEVGDQITVPAGQRAVIEPMGLPAGAPAYFSWEPLPALVQPPVRAASRLQLAVVQPLADLRLAVLLGLRAVGRLAAGLTGLALPAAALSAQSRACRAHGAMS